MKNKINISRAYFLPLVFMVVFLLALGLIFPSPAQAGCCYCGDINTNPNFCIKDVTGCSACSETQKIYDPKCNLCRPISCCVKIRKLDKVIDQCVSNLFKEECEKVESFTISTGTYYDKSCSQVSECVGEKKEEKKIIYFKPNITIPGSKFITGREVPVNGETLGEWISAFYIFFCGVVGILAAVNIIFGGFKYLTSFGNASRMSAAKERITSAIIGLFLTLGAYVILVTISPQLVQFKSLSIKEIETLEQTFEPGAELPEDYGVGQECFYTTYGKTKEEVEGQLVNISFQGKDVQVHKKAQEDFNKVNQAITSAGVKYGFDSVITFSWREAVGAEGKMSLHSFGIAIDINGSRNPYCPHQWDRYPNLTAEQKEKCKNGELVSDLPSAVINAFKNNGFVWGGNWNTSKDAMHFEWHGNCY